MGYSTGESGETRCHNILNIYENELLPALSITGEEGGGAYLARKASRRDK